MAKLDINAIKIQIATQKSSLNAIGAVLDKKAEEILETRKEKFINEFIEHPFSQEIEAGPQSSNTSGSLDGKGNLFSFIGFPVDQKPIEEVVDILEKEIKLKGRIQGRNVKGQFKAGGDNLLFDYPIEGPTKEEMFDRTPLKWEPTRSWLKGLEQGIAGFTSYIYWKTAGRSTGGIQANDGRNAKGEFNGSGKPIKLRDGQFHNAPYFSQMYNNFIKLFKGTNEL